MKINHNLIILFFSMAMISLLFFTNSDNSAISTNNSNSNVVGGGIWVHSNEMNTIDLDSVKDQKISNIYLHSNILNKYTDKQIQDFIKKCHDKNIKVHLWISVFRYDNKFHTPNPLVITSRLNYIRECSNIPNIDGVILDYMRYNGKNPAITNEETITDFVKQAREITKDKNIELSICIMPEKEKSISLYGQNVEELSKYVDIIIPMAYKGNYNKNSDWIREITKYYKEKSECKIAPAILTYKSDKNTNNLPIDEVKQDIKAVYNGGADGCSLFKYGYVDVIL